MKNVVNFGRGERSVVGYQIDSFDIEGAGVPTRRPIVAGVLAVKEDDPAYGVYCNAYGLEMTIDDEWPVDTIMFAPPEYVGVITKDTGLTTMGTTYAGSAGIPAGADAGADLGTLKDEDCRYLLVSSALRRTDQSPAVLDVQLRAALDAGLLVVLAIDSVRGEVDTAWLGKVFSGVSRERARDVAVAIRPGIDQQSPPEFQAMCSAVRAVMNLLGIDGDGLRLLYWGSADGTAVASYVAQPDIDGVLLPTCGYVAILAALEAVVGHVAQKEGHKPFPES